MFRLLIEDRSAGLKARYIPLFNKVYNDQAISEKVIDLIMSYDPTPQRKYADWMLRQCLRKGEGEANVAFQVDNTNGFVTVMSEDLPIVAENIKTYDDLKRQNTFINTPEQDINTLSLAKLRDLLKTFTKTEDGKVIPLDYVKKAYNESKVIYDGSEGEVRIVLTQHAAQYFGRNTEWCTAWGGEYGRHPERTCYFNTYSDNLMVISVKVSGKLFQYHKSSSQFMNEEDRSVKPTAFLIDLPEISFAIITYGHKVIKKITLDSRKYLITSPIKMEEDTTSYQFLSYDFSKYTHAQIDIVGKECHYYINHQNNLNLVDAVTQFLNELNVVPRPNTIDTVSPIKTRLDGTWVAVHTLHDVVIDRPDFYVTYYPATYTYFVISKKPREMLYELSYIEKARSYIHPSYPRDFQKTYNGIRFDETFITLLEYLGDKDIELSQAQNSKLSELVPLSILMPYKNLLTLDNYYVIYGVDEHLKKMLKTSFEIIDNKVLINSYASIMVIVSLSFNRDFYSFFRAVYKNGYLFEDKGKAFFYDWVLTAENERLTKQVNSEDRMILLSKLYERFIKQTIPEKYLDEAKAYCQQILPGAIYFQDTNGISREIDLTKRAIVLAPIDSAFIANRQIIKDNIQQYAGIGGHPIEIPVIQKIIKSYQKALTRKLKLMIRAQQ